DVVAYHSARHGKSIDVVAYHSARHGKSIARGIAEPYLREGQIEEHLVYPVTTETTDESADRIAAHLDAGRDVALLAEGDPLFYSSYMHMHTRLTERFDAVIDMHTRLTERFDAVIVPGVTSVSAASAATGTPLVQGDEVLTIL
ncbi:SAM-dependent methyltransferase, partial [Mycolicibacter minnesotensis]|uniref:SAM-dependent methyltransferase n=1 Tax=Mycolicibacter minnesotensis TaxID=1118379 RepID=UPI0023DFD4D4